MKAACIGLLAVAGFAVLVLVLLVLGWSEMWGWWWAVFLSAAGLAAIVMYVWLDGLPDSGEYLTTTDHLAHKHSPSDTQDRFLYPQAFVYFIENQAGHVKIGWSKDPVKRLKTLQTGSSEPLSLMYVAEFIDEADARDFERLLHRHLAARRVHGEWFTAEDIDYERLIRTVGILAGFDVD